MNNREAMQKAFEGQKFKVFSPFKCNITKNEDGDYVHDETIFAFAWFCRGQAALVSQAQQEPLDFVQALNIADSVFSQYKKDHLKWWKRMDGTPILNDVSVRMAQAFVDVSLPPAPEGGNNHD